MEDDCDGVTLEEFCAGLDEPIKLEAVLAAIRTLVVRGLVTECPDHPGYYKIPDERVKRVHTLLRESPDRLA